MLTATELSICGYERVVEFTDTDFHAFISVHNTTRGPALGGCRVKEYASRSDALDDVLRLSKAMTLKSALADLALGGGKMIVMAPKATKDIMLKVGEAVEHFKGTYITAEDIGTTVEDMLVIAENTKHVVRDDGSYNTARGVFSCLQEAISYIPINRYRNLSEVSIWIQGLGKVGYDLLRLWIAGQGDRYNPANTYVSDIRPEAVQKAIRAFGVQQYDPTVHKVEVYAPCAIGNVVNSDTFKSHLKLICGSANNQLNDDSYAEKLHAWRISYVPDFLTNAGGVITAAGEINNWSGDYIRNRCDTLGLQMLKCFEIADKERITSLAAAKQLANIEE